MEVLLEIQQRFSLLKKQKKPFKIFQMLSNLHLSKVILGIKYDTKLTLSLSSNVFDDSNDENNLPHKLFLTNTHVSRLCKIFAHISSANTELPKTHLHKIGPSGRFLGRILGPLPVIGLPLMKNIRKPLGLTAAASVTDVAI